MNAIARVALAVAALATPAANAQDAFPPVPKVYRDGLVPVVYDFEQMDLGRAAQALGRDLDCVQELTDYGRIVYQQDGAWLKRRITEPVYIPLADEAPRPVTTLIYCTPRKSTFKLQVVYLGGAAYPEISAKIIPITPGEAGVARCLSKAERIVASDPRFRKPDPLEKTDLYNRVEFEDRSLGLGYAVSCHDLGDAMVAVYGKAGRDPELAKMVAAMQQP